MIFNFRMFEGMEYDVIPIDEYEHGRLFWENSDSFTSSEKSRIRKFLASKDISIRQNLVDMEKLDKSPIFFSKKIGRTYLSIQISKLEDDWFAVRASNLDGSEYYKCDQFEGLVEFLKKQLKDLPDVDPNIMIDKEDNRKNLEDLRKIVYKKIRILSYDELDSLNKSLK